MKNNKIDALIADAETDLEVAAYYWDDGKESYMIEEMIGFAQAKATIAQARALNDLVDMLRQVGLSVEVIKK